MQSFATLINIKKDRQGAENTSIILAHTLAVSLKKGVFFFKPRHKTDRHNRKVTSFCNEIEILLKNNSFLAYNYISY